MKREPVIAEITLVTGEKFNVKVHGEPLDYASNMRAFAREGFYVTDGDMKTFYPGHRVQCIKASKPVD